MKVRAKYKICRRLGTGVFEKCQTERYAVSEAKKMKSTAKKGRRGSVSDFGRQLIAKQRVRFMYGLPEKQFARYAKIALTEAKKGEKPSVRLFERLELRLDNVIYRTGLAETRRQARQIASHGHLTVSGHRSNVPSLEMRPDMTFGLREGSRGKKAFATAKERLVNVKQPTWIAFNPETMEGSIKARPGSSAEGEILSDIESALEYYSR
jgi:small subunit ribosomal protein S4